MHAKHSFCLITHLHERLRRGLQPFRLGLVQQLQGLAPLVVRVLARRDGQLVVRERRLCVG